MSINGWMDKQNVVCPHNGNIIQPQEGMKY